MLASSIGPDSTVAPSKSTSCFEEDESCLRVMVASFESDR